MNWVMYNTIYILIKASIGFDFTALKVFEDYDHYYELGEKQKSHLLLMMWC